MVDRHEPIRWGIAGTGSISTQMVAALGTLSDARVVAVGSRTAASAEQFATANDIDRAHGSYEALFADDDVDIVYIGTPHTSHAPMTIDALDAGRHVLCEKPFAVNASQATAMVDAAERNDRFLMEAMWTWFIPTVIDLRDRIRAGAIGDVRVVHADFGMPSTDPDSRHRRPDLAGGALLDRGVYPLWFARYLLGPATAITAVATLTDGVDTTLAGVATHPDGAFATFHTSIDVLSPLTATVIGTEGRIEVDAPFWFPDAYTVHGDRRPGRTATPAGERVSIDHAGLAHEAAHAMDRIRTGHRESDVVPLATSLDMMRTLDDIRAQVGLVYPADA